MSNLISSQPKSYLVIQLRQLGDILLTTPCIKAIKEDNPLHRVVFLSHDMGRLILKDSPFVDQILTYRENMSLNQHYILLKTLYSLRIDVVLDFMNNPRSALYTLATFCPLRFSFSSSRFFAYNRRIEADTGKDYIVREKFRLLRAAGLSPRDESLQFVWKEDALAPFLELLQKPKFASASLRILLSPTHRRMQRKWPLLSYVALAQKLIQDWGACVVWVWGPGEESEIDEAMRLCREPTLKIPKCSLTGLSAIMSNCDLFIGNSNGPSHFAVASQIPSLQLHGHTSAVSWCPRTPTHRAIQGHKMEDISVDSVWEELSAFKEHITKHAQQRLSRDSYVKHWLDR